MLQNLLLADLATGYEYREDQPFFLSSGIQSKEYLDCSIPLSNPSTMNLAARLILDRIPRENVAIGGMTMGADPLSIATSMESCGVTPEKPLRWFSIRKESKSHGNDTLIVGYRGEGPVTLVEDVVTTGTSVLNAYEACQKAGLKVNHIIYLVDRGGFKKLTYALPGVGVQVPILSFADVALVGLARQIAIEAHGDQRYGEAKYSESHLPKVVDIIARTLTSPCSRLLAAAWLHDTLEDTKLTRDDLALWGIPWSVREIVDACSDGDGHNRRERKERPYKLIPKTRNAVIVKLADRIANFVSAQSQGRNDLLEMYKKEQKEFHSRLENSLVDSHLADDVRELWYLLGTSF